MAKKNLDIEQINDFEDLKLEELKKLAADHDIEGRSEMNKDDLIDALRNFRASLGQQPVEMQPPAAPHTFDATQVGDTNAVPRMEYERVVNENQQLRAQLQYALQGAVGATQPQSPDPGQANPNPTPNQ